ncbi:MAG: pyridoxal phosphate-dependent aminotransferase [Chloroflexi bacterium]|nr:pyridoxal phosphate-dependent aminotransferase [Chloroflexota bacterium]
MTFKIADRVKNLAGSPTVSVMDRARRLAAAGRSIVDLSGGDPDFPTAPHVTEAAVAALHEGFTHYTPSRGIPELLQAISRKLAVENGIRYDPGKEIIVMPGGKQALFVAAQALLNPGDEVILFEPCWVSYAPCAELAGARAVYVPMHVDTTAEDLRADLARALTPRTRLIIVNTPNNPTGQVWTAGQLQAVADAALAHDIWVLADEIYERLIYDGRQHISIAGLPGMWERTLTLNGLSKSHAMTGWRLGYIAGPAQLIGELLKVHQHSTTCASSFVQRAAVAALKGPQDYTEMMVRRYQARRDALVAALNTIPGVRCDAPQGAFYAFPHIAAAGLSSMQFTERLLEAEGVAVTPGGAFGAAGEGHVRLSYANSDEMLREGTARIQRFVVELRAAPASM